MDELKKFFDDIDEQLKRQSCQVFNISDEAVSKYYKTQKEIKESIAAKEAREKKEQEKIIGIANNTITVDFGLDKKTEENKAFLEYFESKMKASIARQQSFIPKGKSKEVENLEELAEYTNKRINEEKALRTTAELINDQESIVKHTQTIVELESNRQYYTDQINKLLASQ